MKLILLFAFAIGFFAGLRSLTAPAMVAWATYLGWINLSRPLSLIGSLPAVIILSALAVMEVIIDKMPSTPNRTAALGLVARIVTGGVTGACISVGGGQGALAGAGLGMLGGVVGAFAGYHARLQIVTSLSKPDFYVALFEDLVAIGGSLLIVSRF